MTQNAAQGRPCRWNVRPGQVFVQCERQPIGSGGVYRAFDDRDDSPRVRGKVPNRRSTLSSGFAENERRFVSKRPRRAGAVDLHADDVIDCWRTGTQ